MPQRMFFATGEPATRTATLSAHGLYRYELARWWEGDDGDPLAGAPLVWIMSNPSTADAKHDDPTIRRIMGFTRRWGWPGLVVVNLFARRATVARDLAKDPDRAVGPDNDDWLGLWLNDNVTVVAAWGAASPWKGALATRRQRLADMLLSNRELWCLGTTREGHPRHPLYLPNKAELERFEL